MKTSSLWTTKQKLQKLKGVRKIKMKSTQSTKINYMGQNKNPIWYFGTKTEKGILQKVGVKVGGMPHSSKFADLHGFLFAKIEVRQILLS